MPAASRRCSDGVLAVGRCAGGVLAVGQGGSHSRATAASQMPQVKGVIFATIAAMIVCALRKRSLWRATLPYVLAVGRCAGGVPAVGQGGSHSGATAASQMPQVKGVIFATIASMIVCALRKRSLWRATLPYVPAVGRCAGGVPAVGRGGSHSRATAASQMPQVKGVIFATIASMIVCALRKRSLWRATLPCVPAVGRCTVV